MPETLTSDSHPIDVHFVPVGDLPLDGRIGFALAPGRKGPGNAGMHDRDLEADLQRLRTTFGATVLVSLVTDQEAEKRTGVRAEDERRAAESRGMTFHHLPVAPGQVPDDDALVNLVQLLRDQVELGHTVVVHDRAGGGRAASVVAALLIGQGHDADGAIGAVRTARPKAVEPMQEKRLRAAAARLAERAAPLLATVESAFAERGWKYERPAGVTFVRTVLQKDESHVPIIVTTAERYEQVHAFGLLQAPVPEHARGQVSELLHRINWSVPFGAFEMDLDSGAVRFHVALDVEGGSLVPAQVGTLVQASMGTVTAFAPRIAAVAHGGVRPREALGRSSAQLN